VSSWLRRAALVAVTAGGLASLLATSPPPPPQVILGAEPATVCAGDEVTLRWEVVDQFSSTTAPDDLRLATSPVDAFDPPVEGTAIAAEGELVARPHRPVYVSVGTEQESVWVPSVPGIAVFPCDLVGSQVASSRTLRALVADDANGTLFAAFASPSDDGTTRVERLDDALATVWDTTIDATIDALAVHVDGGLVVAGDSASALDGGDEPATRRAVVRRYDAEGDALWTWDIGGDDAEGPATRALGVAWRADDVVVVGQSYGAGTVTEGIVALLDAEGSLVWERRIVADGVGGGYASARSVRVGSDGTIYVSGTTSGDVGGPGIGPHDAFLIAFDGDGVRLPWSEQVAGTIDSGAVALGSGDTVVLAGQALTAWPAGGGAPVWTAAAPPGVEWRRLAEAAGGTLLAAGHVAVDVDLPNAPNLDHVDVVLVHVDADGVVLSERRLGSLSNEVLEALAAWPTLRPTVAVIGGRTFGDFLQPNGGGPQAFVLELPID